MEKLNWFEEFEGAITVCDANGIIIEMNKAAQTVFKDDGGANLIGKNVLDCHPEPSRSKLQSMMENRTRNVYTIEKGGKWKMIYQSPIFQDGQYAGFVEISVEIPSQMPHFVRSKS